MKKAKVGNRQAKKAVVIVEKPSPKKKKGGGGKKGTVPSGTLRAFGGIAGGFLGGPTGALIGSTAGSLISRITGFGGYKVNKNSIVQGNSIPTFSQGGDGVVIQHKEFLVNISGTTAFTLQSFAINPGLQGSFPLLSLMAANFEEYEMMGLVFIYRPSSGSAISSASSALGVVVLATDYDALNPLFVNKQQMESYEFSSSTVPFNECIHPVECARRRNVLDNLYTRVGSVPATADRRLYDMGNFQIATEGMQSAYVVGELWVSYHVSLKKPRIPNSPSLLYYMHGREGPVNTASAATFFGTTMARVSADSFLPGVMPVSATEFLFSQPGFFFVTLSCVTTTAMTTGVFLTLGANVTVNYVFSDDTITGVPGILAENAVTIYSISVTAGGLTSANYVTTTGAAGLVAGTSDIVIFPCKASTVFTPRRPVEFKEDYVRVVIGSGKGTL